MDKGEVKAEPWGAGEAAWRVLGGSAGSAPEASPSEASKGSKPRRSSVLLLARRGVATAGRRMVCMLEGDGRGVGVPPPAGRSAGPGAAGGSAAWGAAVEAAAAGGSDAVGRAEAGEEARAARSEDEGAGGAGRGDVSDFKLVAGGDRGSRFAEERAPSAGGQRRRGPSLLLRAGCPAEAGREVSWRRRAGWWLEAGVRREPEPLPERRGDGGTLAAPFPGGGGGRKATPLAVRVAVQGRRELLSVPWPTRGMARGRARRWPAMVTGAVGSVGRKSRRGAVEGGRWSSGGGGDAEEGIVVRL
jgi:hypothetical protein